MKTYSTFRRSRAFANDTQAFNPTFWANESLQVYEEAMTIGGLVHRDFSPLVAEFGDTVKTRKVREFEAKRKGPDDDVVIQNAAADGIDVKLNHHVHVGFLIRDGQESYSMKPLIDEFIVPAIRAEARYSDTVLNLQAYRFIQNGYGRLGNFGPADVVDRLTNMGEIMTVNKLPEEGRNMMLTPKTKTQMMQNSNFTDAAYIGDTSNPNTALRKAYLGQLYGFENFTAVNAPNVPAAGLVKTVTTLINNAAGYNQGDTTVTVDGVTGALLTGAWCTVAGDDSPQRITAHTETLGNTTSIVLWPGLKRAVADNAIITIYTPGTVNLSGGYAAGWYDPITVANFSVAPKKGQLVSFGNASDLYGVLSATTTSITLDRPLDAAIADAAVVGIGPPGQYNFTFLRNALAMVNRPLALPREGTGALAAVVQHNNISIRAVITYQGMKQGHLVVLDMLMGYAVLDVNNGAVMFA